MKKILLVSILTFLIYNVTYAQNGTYKSTRFEFISQSVPSRNRVELKYNTLTIQINEIQGEFIDGKILWEMKSDDNQSEFLEMCLKSLKNSHYDEANKAFVKVYYADIKMLGQTVGQSEIFIWKFVNENNYRIDMFDSVKKTINRFDNVTKL